MRDGLLWPQLIVEVQLKKIKVVKSHPAICSVAGKELQETSCRMTFAEKISCGKVEITEERSCGRTRYLS